MFGGTEEDGEEEDWIDKALKAGQGFKSEDERNSYIASIGWNEYIYFFIVPRTYRFS